MATAPNSNINIPYSEFLNATTGRPNQEWLMWLMNPQFITVTLGSALPVTSGGTGLTTIPTNGQLLIGNGTGYTLNPLTPGVGISVTNGVGAITVANTGVLSWSGGSTGLTPATATTGAVTLAGTLGAGYGGTGLNTYVIGDILYSSGTTALSRLADVATGNALISGGVATAPSWGKIGLTTHVSGTLPISNGGTNGTATATAGAIAYGTGSAYAFTSAGTLGQVLTSAGAGTPTWAAAATGTVTSVSVVSANGLAGTVATATTTPAITLSTTVTGLLKGNGTAISAATSGTDYAPATSGTSILYGNGSGGFSNVTIGTGVAFAGGTLSATGSGGTVTSVTGTAPVVSSGGTTPAISMAAATTSVNGYLTSTDWNTFNGKGSGTVTSVAALTLGTTGTDLSSTVANGTTTPVITLQVPTASATNRGALSAADWTTFNNKGSGSVTSVAQSFTGGLISVAGSPITTSGTLALTVAGTSGGIPYFSSASTWATSAALTASALVVGGGAGAAPATTTTGTGVITALGVNTGTAGAFVVNGGALGTPSSGTVTNLTGTASININGTVGATTRNTGLFTTLGANSAVTLSGAAASVHTLGTSATTGTVTIGGTAMTGTLTFGQSTTTNAVNINTGVTASGNTKSTYICTNGAAGSIVNVEMGSTLASTSNTLVNGRLFAYRTTAGGNPGFRCYGTSTDQNYIQIDSTGGGLTALGVNGSVGAELGTGTTAYATVLGSYVNVPVEIVVNNAKVASFASTGLAVTGTAIASTSVGVGNTTPSGGGAGIAFPATQSASTDANTLDDYEEGTWTPSQGAGLTVVGTFSSAGTYTKIGRSVTIYGRVSGSTTVAVAASNTVFCAGLPFSGGGDNVYPGVAQNNSTTAGMFTQVTTTTIYAVGTMSATTNIYFSTTYFV